MDARSTSPSPSFMKMSQSPIPSPIPSPTLSKPPQHLRQTSMPTQFTHLMPINRSPCQSPLFRPISGLSVDNKQPRRQPSLDIMDRIPNFKLTPKNMTPVLGSPKEFPMFPMFLPSTTTTATGSSLLDVLQTGCSNNVLTPQQCDWIISQLSKNSVQSL
jgi:hypothetical protein